MKALNDWSNAYLGTWVTEFAPIILIIAVALAVILLITFIICALCHAHNIKKFRKLKEERGSAPADEAAVRESVEAKVRAEYESAATDNSAQYIERIDAMTARIDELTYADKEKQSRIDALTEELDKARSSSGTADAENSARIVELDRMLNEKQSEIDLLKAENSQIKAQALQQQLAAQQTATAQQTAKKTAASSEMQQKTAAPKKQTKTAQHVDQPLYEEESPASEDEYDEYYDDYGDATSEVKVTVKFDRLKNSWVILRSDTDRAYRRLATKQEALGIAKDLARRLHAQLVVHKKDGKFQKV